MAASGCIAIKYGKEPGSESLLQATRINTKREQIRRGPRHGRSWHRGT